MDPLCLETSFNRCLKHLKLKPLKNTCHVVVTTLNVAALPSGARGSPKSRVKAPMRAGCHTTSKDSVWQRGSPHSPGTFHSRKPRICHDLSLSISKGGDLVFMASKIFMRNTKDIEIGWFLCRNGGLNSLSCHFWMISFAHLNWGIRVYPMSIAISTINYAIFRQNHFGFTKFEFISSSEAY